ncbi:MAG: molybdopterin oxidoreductase family protein [Candidatus Binatia bacterium]|nr:molybdopterin oxidoreductase family protein [Candidatus Binatia bacterium]
MSTTDTESTHFHTCPLCEACCNLEIKTRGRAVVSVRGDEGDPFSNGFICPKGAAIGALDADPDRLRSPLIKRDGQHVEATWDEAFAEIDRNLPRIADEHGRDAVAAYLGNPSAHHVGHGLYGRVLLKGLATHNLYSASTVDQMPKQVSSGLMFGGSLSVPIPDVDHTDHLWILGGNPLVSNGSLMTAPDMKGRLRKIRERGGKIVVFDPRRTRTAEAADEHHFIRPGRDVFFLLGVIHTLLTEERAAPGRLAEMCNGLDQIGGLVRDYSPETVADVCGIEADEIRRLARELSEAQTSSVYARIGTCTQEFGTTTSWLVDVVNVLTGNLDRAGGALFTKAAIGAANAQSKPGTGRGMRLGRFRSRVRNLPEACGELPVACLSEEIETPGDGQIRALITICGNPVLSTPNGARLKKALESLEFMVSVDIYLNETTRHADVVLPGLSPLEQPHYPLAFTQLAVRNFARFSPPIFDVPEGQMEEWRILLRLAGIVTGQGPNADIDALDDFVFEQILQKAVANEYSPIHGRDADDIRRQTSRYRGPERMLDLQLRTGVYGDAFGSNPGGLNLATLAVSGHAVDLGPLGQRLPEALQTPSGKIELTPEPLVADLDRVRARLDAEKTSASLVLVGRRDLRSNNSWMHNIPGLVSGRARCTLHVHPEDAARLGLADGKNARVSSRTGSVDAPVEVTDSVMPGVMSLPHGWGHDDTKTRLGVARANAGVSSNDLTDEAQVDAHSGNAVLNGIPIQVEAI